MDRYRLISSIVVLIVFFLAIAPVQTIIIGVVCVIAYFVIRDISINSTGSYNSPENRRREVLRNARLYLSPYNSIWRDLKLSNKYCELILGSDGKTITARDKFNNRRKSVVKRSRVYDNNELWNLLCERYGYATTYNDLVILLNSFSVVIDDSSYKNAYEIPRHTATEQEKVIHVDAEVTQRLKQAKEKLDINNASEVEITALPGVSIVMAKKIIKRREEIRGFKTVDDVCAFLHLRPHMENQLRELICVNKMKGSVKITLNKERSIDL